MNDWDDASIEHVLTSRGLESLLPVSPDARRLGSTVWSAQILTRFGDAPVQLQVYPLGREPESIVDMEEEISALDDARSPRRLVHEIRDDEWGILITCAPEHYDIVHRFLTEGAREDESAYHPQLDRILGEDYFGEYEGHWFKFCFAPLERAMGVPDLLKAAEAAYGAAPQWPGKLESPMPRLLALYEVPATELKGAPESYNRRALMQFVIGSPRVIQLEPPETAEAREAFARQLFGFLAAEHQAGICFTRDAGCCLRSEFLLADGSLTDIYFMWRPADEAKQRHAMQTDLWNAMLVTCELAGGDAAQGGELLLTALRQYTRSKRLGGQVRDLIAAAANGVQKGNSAALQALLREVVRV